MPPLPLQSTAVVVSAQPSVEGKDGNDIWEEGAATVELAATGFVWLALAPVIADPGAAVDGLPLVLAGA